MHNKIQIQENQYNFPYHHIPHFADSKSPSVFRKLKWGLEYLCYQYHIIDKVTLMNPESVLEIGCGDGFFIGHLPPKIPTRIGVDLSEKSIAFAKAFHPECLFYAQDASTLETSFDVVTAIEVIEHIPEDELPAFFQTLFKRTKDNGKIVISVPTTVLPLNKKHYRHYTAKLLVEQIQKTGISFKLYQEEYIYCDPWWFRYLKKALDNKYFSLEIKPLMRFTWKHIWNNYRLADKNTGHHLVLVLAKS